MKVIRSEGENVKLMMKNFHLKNFSSNKELMSSVMKDEMQGSEECGEARLFVKLAKKKIDGRINPS